MIPITVAVAFFHARYDFDASLDSSEDIMEQTNPFQNETA
jgi:hypothetical protein